MKSIRQFFALLILTAASPLLANDAGYTAAFVDSLVKPYFQIHEGLAGDDLGKAQVGAKALSTAMEKAPTDPDFANTDKAIVASANAISGATDITAARTQFQTLSSELVKLIKHTGVTEHSELYLSHCPMAHKGEGGTWIQSDKAIANPYFGKKMAKCGSIKETIHDSANDGFSKDHLH